MLPSMAVAIPEQVFILSRPRFPIVALRFPFTGLPAVGRFAFVLDAPLATENGMDIPHLPPSNIAGVWIRLAPLDLFGTLEVFQSSLRLGRFLCEQCLVVVIRILDDVPQKSLVGLGLVRRSEFASATGAAIASPRVALLFVGFQGLHSHGRIPQGEVAGVLVQQSSDIVVCKYIVVRHGHLWTMQCGPKGDAVFQRVIMEETGAVESSEVGVGASRCTWREQASAKVASLPSILDKR